MTTRRPPRYRIEPTSYHTCALHILQSCALGEPGETYHYWSPSQGGYVRQTCPRLGVYGSAGKQFCEVNSNVTCVRPHGMDLATYMRRWCRAYLRASVE